MKVVKFSKSKFKQKYFEPIVSLLCKMLNKNADLSLVFYLVSFFSDVKKKEN